MTPYARQPGTTVQSMTTSRRTFSSNLWVHGQDRQNPAQTFGVCTLGNWMRPSGGLHRWIGCVWVDKFGLRCRCCSGVACGGGTDVWRHAIVRCGGLWRAVPDCCTLLCAVYCEWAGCSALGVLRVCVYARAAWRGVAWRGVAWRGQKQVHERGGCPEGQCQSGTQLFVIKLISRCT